MTIQVFLLTSPWCPTCHTLTHTIKDMPTPTIPTILDLACERDAQVAATLSPRPSLPQLIIRRGEDITHITETHLIIRALRSTL